MPEQNGEKRGRLCCIGVSGMLIEKLMETFENTLDACEEVGDIVKIIIVRALR